MYCYPVTQNRYRNAMPNYTKLFNSIITSTIWTEDDKTRIMWITMLAMADKNGEVHGSIPGMARLAGMTLEEAEAAIGRLMSPDAYSRTPDHEGRRIAAIPGGWEVLNHGKYRLMASKEDAKAATAERVRRHRSRNASVTQCNGNVTDGNSGVTVGRDIAEAEADTKADKEEPPNPLKGEHGGFFLELPEDRKPKVTASPAMIRIAKIVHPTRRDSTAWNKDESKAFNAIDFIDDEISLVEDFYRFTERDREPLFRRTSLLTLLRHWTDEVGKASAWAVKYGRTRATTNTNRTGK